VGRSANQEIVRAAVERGTAYILRSRSGDGWWRDFKNNGGVSDQWITAYVGCALAGTSDALANGTARSAYQQLATKLAGRPGWSYNDGVPPDADSTIWACRLAEALGDCSGVATTGLQFLQRCQRLNGGIATYPAADDVRRAMRLPGSTRFRGWCVAHTCVTGAASGLNAFRNCSRLRNFLVRAQDPEGYWPAYWWCDPEYATALSCEGLANSQSEAETLAVNSAADWARQRGSAGTPFALSWRARILATVHDSAAQDLAAVLAGCQLEDGSWAASARMRIPPPYLKDPKYYWGWSEDETGIGSVRTDPARLFTTASVLMALTKCLSI
jgi:squalene-hopene/tetraprenyl-beta-curcumene cyclase